MRKRQRRFFARLRNLDVDHAVRAVAMNTNDFVDGAVRPSRRNVPTRLAPPSVRTFFAALDAMSGPLCVILYYKTYNTRFVSR